MHVSSKFSIVSNPIKSTSFLARTLAEKLIGSGLVIDDENPDYVISVGGDGTFLSAVQKYSHLSNTDFRKIIFLGLHTGNIGFLNDFETCDEIVKAILSKSLISTNSLIQTKIGSDSYFLINEIRIIDPIKPLPVELWINNDLFEKIIVTGICVSSSTGSSAFNKSLGGALVFPSLETMQIILLAPIKNYQNSIINNPIIFSKKEKLSIKGCFQTAKISIDNYGIPDLGCEIIELNISERQIQTCNAAKYSDKLKRTFIRT